MAHRAVFSSILGLVALAYGPVSASISGQGSQPRVLVMPFSIQADSAAPDSASSVRWLGEAAATLLADELHAQGYGAFAREDRVAVFDRLNVPMSSELTRATMIRIADLIGASEVVFGEVRVGAELVVRARTIRLDTGRLMPESTDRAAPSEMFALFGRLAQAVGRQTGRVAKARPAAVAPMPQKAFEEYIKGLIAPTPAGQQRLLESAMMQAPRDGRVLTALWTVYADQGLHDKALSVASAVPAGTAQYRRARWNTALSLIELRRFDGALKELGTLHTQDRSAAISNAIGITELRRAPVPGSAQKAAVYFERAAAEAPQDSDYAFNLGYARALAGDQAAAVTWLRETVRMNAADGDAHLVMAAVLSAGGRPAEAQRELELARTLGTSLDVIPATVTRVPPALERVRTRLDDLAPGVTALRTPAQRDQIETARFHLTRGRTLFNEGRDREAIVELQRAIYLAPYEDEPHLLIGELYRRAGRLAEAVDEFRVALWCRETVNGRIALGRAFLESGDRDAAKREVDRALVLSPDSAEARELLRKIGGTLSRIRVLTSSAAHE